MVYEGIAGSVKLGEKAVAHMSEWSLEMSRDMKEATFFGGDGYKEKKPGAKDWSASFNGIADFETDTTQQELINAFDRGTKISAGFYLDDKTFFKGNAYIESLTIDNSSEDGPNIDISLAGTGGVIATIPVIPTPPATPGV